MSAKDQDQVEGSGESVDLDEDLFDFDEVGGADITTDDDDLDLDEIFKSFQASEQAANDATAVPDLPAPHEDDDEEIGVEDAVDAVSLDAFDEEDLGVEETVAALTAQLGTEDEDDLDDPFAALEKPTVTKTEMHLHVPRVAVAGVAVLTLLNISIALLTMKTNSDVTDDIASITRKVDRTAQEVREEAYLQAAAALNPGTPISLTNPKDDPTFERAQREIDDGKFATARQRLYGLLSNVDRLDSEKRAEVEALAQYLIAESIHREAMAAQGSAR